MKPTHQGCKEIEENDFLDALVGVGVSMTILIGVFLLITVISFLI